MLETLQAKLIAAGVVVIVLAGIAFSIYNKGKDVGRVEGAADQLQSDRQQFEQDRKQFLDTLATYKAKDEAAQQLIHAQDSQLAMLRSARASARTAVDKLADAELGKDIHQKLGNPPTDDPLTAAELRRLDVTLTDYPNVVAQNELLNKKIDALGQRVDALEHQRDAAVEAYNKLVPLYAKAYNAAQKKHSKFVKIITFGLVKDRKIDLPAPVTLVPPTEIKP